MRVKKPPVAMVECVGCGLRLSVSPASATRVNAEEVADRDGWDFWGGEWLCPACAGSTYETVAVEVVQES